MSVLPKVHNKFLEIAESVQMMLSSRHDPAPEVTDSDSLVTNFLLTLEANDFLNVRFEQNPPNASIDQNEYTNFCNKAKDFVKEFYCADAEFDRTANFMDLAKLKPKDFEAAEKTLDGIARNLTPFASLIEMDSAELKAIVKKLIYFICRNQKTLDLDTMIACSPGLKLTSKLQYSNQAKLKRCKPEQMAVLKLLFSIHNDKKLMYRYDNSPKASHAMSLFVQYYFGSDITTNFSINLDVNDDQLKGLFDDLRISISPPPSRRQIFICVLTILIAILNLSYVIYDSNSTCETENNKSICRGRYRGTYFTFSALVLINSILGAFGAFVLRPYYKRYLNWAIFVLTIVSGLFIIPLIVLFSGDWFEFAVSLLVPGLLSLINLSVLFR